MKRHDFLKLSIILLFPFLFTMGTCDVNTPDIATLSASIDSFETTFNLNSKEWQALIDELSKKWADLTTEQIEKLIKESGEYKDILRDYNATAQDFIDQLEAMREELPIHLHWVVADIERILNKTVGAMSSNVLCIGNVVQHMLLKTLDEIKLQLIPGDTPYGGTIVEYMATPGICQTSMTSVDLTLPSYLRRELVFYGYDITIEVAKDLSLILYREGNFMEFPDRISRGGNGQVTVDLASPLPGSGNKDLNPDLVLSQYKRIQLFYGDELLSEVPIFK